MVFEGKMSLSTLKLVLRLWCSQSLFSQSPRAVSSLWYYAFNQWRVYLPEIDFVVRDYVPIEPWFGRLVTDRLCFLCAGDLDSEVVVCHVWYLHKPLSLFRYWVSPVWAAHGRWLVVSLSVGGNLSVLDAASIGNEFSVRTAMRLGTTLSVKLQMNVDDRVSTYLLSLSWWD
jgi:hypothetical protein